MVTAVREVKTTTTAAAADPMYTAVMFGPLVSASSSSLLGGRAGEGWR